MKLIKSKQENSINRTDSSPETRLQQSIKSGSESAIENSSSRTPNRVGAWEKSSDRGGQTQLVNNQRIKKKSKPSIGRATNKIRYQLPENQENVASKKTRHMKSALECMPEEQKDHSVKDERATQEMQNNLASAKQEACKEIVDQLEDIKSKGKKTIISNYNTRAEASLRLAENEVRELKAQLEQAEKQAQRNQGSMNKERELFLQEKELFHNDKNQFSTQKALLLEDQKRQDKIAGELKLELSRYKTNNDMIQKKLSTALETISLKNQECLSLKDELEAALSEKDAVKKALESQRKLHAEQMAKQLEASWQGAEEKKALENKLLDLQNQLANAKNLLNEKSRRSDVEIFVSNSENQILGKGVELLPNQPIEIDARAKVSENESDRLRHLIEQNRREREEMTIEKNEIEEQRIMLAQVESALKKERDEIEIQRGRLEGMALLEVASSQNRAFMSHNRRLSQLSLSSEIPDVIIPHPFHLQKLNLPPNFLSNSELSGSSSLDGWEEKEVRQEGAHNYKHPAHSALDYVPGEGESEQSQSNDPGSYPEDAELSSRSLLLSSSRFPRSRSHRQNQEKPTIVFSRSRYKSSRARSARTRRKKRGRKFRKRDAQSANVSPISNMWDGFRFRSSLSLHNNDRETDSEGYVVKRCDSSESGSDIGYLSEPSSKSRVGDSVWFMHPEDQPRNSLRGIVNQSTDPREKYSSEIGKVETKLKIICDWIVDTRNDISALPNNPSTFEEILALIEPQKTKKIKEKLKEVTQLVEQRRALTNANATLVREHFTGKTEEIISLEKWCERELKKIEKISNDKIGQAAVQFKKNLPNLISRYWEEAKSSRKVIEAVKVICEDSVPERFDNLGVVRSSLEEIFAKESELTKLKDKVPHLKKMGSFIGKMRSSDAQDCLIDAMDLNSLYDYTTKNLAKRSELINQKWEKQQEEINTKRMEKVNAFHKTKYIEIMDSVDKIMGELAECGKSGSQEKLSADCAKINSILNEDLPKWRNFVTTKLTRGSAYLLENGYRLAHLVSEREKSLEEMLKQAEQRAAKLQAEVHRLLY